MSVDQRLASLGLTLPTVQTPVANYLTHVRMGNVVYLSGQGPRKPDGTFVTGKVGNDLSVEQGYAAARSVGLQLLALLRDVAGSLEQVRIVKLLGMVNAGADFGDHPKVINGCSDLLVEVLGESGRHARSAVGMASLPGNMAVEIEAIAIIA